MDSTALSGRKQIQAYMGRSWETLLKWRQDLAFPMAMIGDRWESDTRLIELWRRGQIKKAVEE
jgi:hypothetical protein